MSAFLVEASIFQSTPSVGRETAKQHKFSLPFCTKVTIIGPYPTLSTYDYVYNTYIF